VASYQNRQHQKRIEKVAMIAEETT